MPAPEIESVAPSRVAEVAAAVKQQRELAEWKAKFPEAYAELVALRAVYNPSLDAAEKVARAKRVSCGPFVLFKFQASYDGKELYADVGRQKFAALGGVLTTVETLTVDKERFAAAVAQERISPELEAKVVKYTPYYHSVPRIELP